MAIKNLVIVESPAKARTIEKFLGKEFTVKASMGHVRDLPEKRLGFDPNNDFEPEYEITPDKQKIIAELKKLITKDTVVYLASDEDREGEAIAWHLIPALDITRQHTVKRIVFHEITQSAITKAIEHPRTINQSLVDAQQARRLVDRAVGYELSPLLWKKVQPGLSAGRVQSVAVRIIVEREREIRAFIPEEFWKIKADFSDPCFQALLVKIDGKVKRIVTKQEAESIERAVKDKPFIVGDIQEKEGTRTPPAPFTTSTLQQEASRKLGYDAGRTMRIAQQLYEGNVADIPGYSGGLITYMRTDSVNLADVALEQARNVITDEFGKEYALVKPRRYKTTSKGAQEAHEAIRPVNFALKPSDVKQYLDSSQFRLYDLIWKRTLATQMKEANIASTTYHILAGENKNYLFEAKGQRILFPGFLKAYTEGSDDPEEELSHKEILLPQVHKGQELLLKILHLEQNFTKPPARYTEASLVKKLESEGIGRPSTYAPTISTIQARGYVEKTEDKKLKPTSIGEVVNDFLVKHFSDIVDLKFTARIEEDMDTIAEGKKEWKGMVRDFYTTFHRQVVEKEQSVTRAEVSKERILGIDPQSGRQVSVRIGRYGPFVQIGTKDEEEKPLFASLLQGMNMNEVALDDVLPLFKLPRVLGMTEDGQEVIANTGRFGPYVKVGSVFCSLKEYEPLTITYEQAVALYKEEKEKKEKSIIKEFPQDDIRVLNGRFGPYIKQGKNNIKIPKGIVVETLTYEQCKDIIAQAPKNSRRGRFIKKKKKSNP